MAGVCQPLMQFRTQQSTDVRARDCPAHTYVCRQVYFQVDLCKGKVSAESATLKSGEE